MGAKIIGLDLADVTDYTAVAILEALPRLLGAKPRLVCGHLERYERGLRYPTIVDRVAATVNDPRLAADPAFALWCAEQPGRTQRWAQSDPEARRRLAKPTLVVDATGVGRAVVDELREELPDVLLHAIVITAGDSVTSGDGVIRVPKRDIVGALLLAFQSGRLLIADGTNHKKDLEREFVAFKIKVTAAGHDTYGAWREGEHDDLILALGLAAWLAEQGWYGPAECVPNPFYK